MLVAAHLDALYENPYNRESMTYQQVIKHFGGGSLTSAARALGLPVTTVSSWRPRVPYLRQCELELRSAGKLKATNGRNR